MVGGVQEISVDTRVVAATNRDLSQLVQAGAFREDLFYRLNVIGLHLPPLRERREDIPVLVMHFIEKYRKELGRDDIRGVSPEVMDILSTHEFKGNVRELENIVEHAMTFASDDRITPDALPEGLRTSSRSDRSQQDSIFRVPEDGMDLEALLADIERRLLLDALSRCGGVRKNAADLLGISFRSIRYKLANTDLATKNNSLLQKNSIDTIRPSKYHIPRFVAGPIAQPVEQRPFKPLVASSNLAGLTFFRDHRLVV